MTIKKYEKTKSCEHDLTDIEYSDTYMKAKCSICETNFKITISLEEIEVCDSCEHKKDRCECYFCDKHNSRCIEYKDYNGKIRYRYPDVYEDYCEACACQDCFEMPEECSCGKPPKFPPKNNFMNTTMDDVMKCFKIDFKGM